jgi:hypothetical protein
MVVSSSHLRPGEGPIGAQQLPGDAGAFELRAHQSPVKHQIPESKKYWVSDSNYLSGYTFVGIRL